MVPSIRFILIAVFGLFIFTSCEREVENFQPIEQGYFPLESGKYNIYDVEYILYNDFDRTVDTINYQLMEVIGDTSSDNLGRVYYRVERYIKSDPNSSWKFNAVWAAQVENNKAYRVEDNQRYIKLVFPVRNDKDWDGISFIRKDTTISIPGGTIDLFKDWDNFEYSNVHQSENIGALSFDSVTTVLQADKINNIERRYSIEKYAKGVGLIYKEMWILDTQCGGNIATCINTPWEQKAEKGFILRQRLVETNW